MLALKRVFWTVAVLWASVILAATAAAGELEGQAQRTKRDVTFIATSDVHYDAFENEDRNGRVRDTLRHMNEIGSLAWPAQLGGGTIAKPRAVVVLGDVLDDGDRMFQEKVQGAQQWEYFKVDFGLDGTDGLLKFPVFEGAGNHDGPPAGREKSGFSFQAEEKKRNALRKEKGWLANLAAGGLHYSWDWDDVHFVQLNLYPADRQHALIKYSPQYHDPQGALTFLKQDLASQVGTSGRPVVLMSHCGFDTDWWHPDDWKAAYEAAKPYNVILYLYGHTGTGLRDWKPEGEEKPLNCINTGQTENGFFVVQILDDRLRAAYRIKQWTETKTPGAPPQKTWTGNWEWKYPLEKKISAPTAEARFPQAAPPAAKPSDPKPPQASPPRESESKMSVMHKPAAKAYAFPLTDVRLLDGPFKHAMELDRAYLLALDPDRLLHNFRVNAGLPSSAKPLGGWEKPDCELRGHFIGHYLSACALMYASTGDAKFKDRAALMVAGLAECQQKIGSGYLSAYPEEFIDRVEAQKRVWAPWYTLHKIYAGMIDVYVLCGNAQALEVVKKMADWAKARTDRLSDDQMQKMLGNEHGGMNDALAELYAVTGDEKYLKLSQRFNHKAVLEPLAQKEDKLTGLHANTQFPKVIGAARQYELTGDERLRTLATFFWETVTRERSYVIGGNSDGEMFSPKEKLSQAFGPNTTETCNTYNMLKLTRHVFSWSADAACADYYERALYNHILASQNPEDGMTCYYVPLKTGSRKAFGTPNDAFWCCTGTGVENHAKYGDSIYFHDGAKGLYVNLFIASELAWRERGVRLRQETTYPEADTTRLVFTCEKPVELTLSVRHPWWAVSGIELKVNGQMQAAGSKPGSYATIARTWKTGDTVDLKMPMTIRTEGFRDNPRRLAIMYGPVVLCAEVNPQKPAPSMLGKPEDVAPAVKPVAGKALAFTLPSSLVRTAGEEPLGDVTLTPFYKQDKKPYIVYWDVLTDEQWKQRQEEHKAAIEKQKLLKARAVDTVEIGQTDSEKKHDMTGEKTSAGEFNGKHYRHATDSGWFSYRMKVLPDKPVEILCTYWGSDGGGRTFDVLVDGTKVATEKLAGKHPGQFFDQVYAVPPDLTKGKDTAVIKFQAQPNNWAGGVFGCAVLRKE